MGRKKGLMYMDNYKEEKYAVQIGIYKETVVHTHVRVMAIGERGTDMKVLRKPIKEIFEQVFVSQKREFVEVKTSDWAIQSPITNIQIDIYKYNFDGCKEFILNQIKRIFPRVEEICKTLNLRLMRPQKLPKGEKM